MKLIDVAKAYMALEALAEEKLPIRISYGLTRAMDKLERPYVFYANKEAQLMQEIPADEQNGTTLRFSDPAQAARFNAAHADLDNLEEEVQIRPVEIPVGLHANISWKNLRELQQYGIIRITGAETEESEGTGDGQRETESCSCGRH